MDGEHAAWFEKHFNFFNMLNKRDELYDAWKVMELEFRQDHRSRHLKFSVPDYDKALGLTEESHKLCKEFQDFAASQTAVQLSGLLYHGNSGPSSQGNLPWGPFQPPPTLSPFRQAAASPPPVPSASSVHKGGTTFS